MQFSLAQMSQPQLALVLTIWGGYASCGWVSWRDGVPTIRAILSKTRLVGLRCICIVHFSFSTKCCTKCPSMDRDRMNRMQWPPRKHFSFTFFDIICTKRQIYHTMDTQIVYKRRCFHIFTKTNESPQSPRLYNDRHRRSLRKYELKLVKKCNKISIIMTHRKEG